MTEIIDSYKEIHQEKIKIEKMAKELKIEEAIPLIHKLYDASFNNTISLWKNNKKACRTNDVKKAMGKKYPFSIYNLSLTLDSIINNLDDILDNKLSEEKKALHLLEAGKNIGKMMLISSQLNKKYMEVIDSYFNQIIPIICGGEITYIRMLECMKDEYNPKNICIKYYNSRVIDFDAFVEIPMIESGFDGSDISKMLYLGRNFRAINLIKKDLIDIPEDIKNNTKTVFTILKTNKKDIIKYAMIFSENYLNLIEKINFDTWELEKVKQNFFNMAKDEKNKIKNLNGFY